MTSSADFMVLGDGRALLRGATARLVRWFDDRFLQMAREGGAVACRFPATIAGDVLTRAGYFDAHPDGGPRDDGAGDKGLKEESPGAMLARLHRIQLTRA